MVDILIALLLGAFVLAGLLGSGELVAQLSKRYRLALLWGDVLALVLFWLVSSAVIALGRWL